MIQRIQSIFLLLSGGAAFSLFGLDFASTPNTDVAAASMFADGAFNIMDNPVMMGAFGLAGALAIAAIFLFNNRQLQSRLSLASFIVGILGCILSVVFLMQDPMASDNIDDGLGIYPAIASLIFALLAMRFIKKDDNLVKSMDRLR